MSSSEAPAAPAASPAAASSTKKKAKTTVKKSAPTHPKTADMVDSAILGLKERGGSSLLAIKKYLAANYKVDAEKLSHFIKKYLRSAVASGKLIQTKGKGASGSFKLASRDTKKKTGESESKPAKKKPASVQKKTEAPKKAASKKEAKASPKARKPAKSPVAKKPKAPKPKKAAPKRKK